MRKELSISTHRGVRSVKDRRCGRVLDIETPFPVGEVAFIAAVVAEVLLVGIGEVAVPGEECAGKVDIEGLLEVDNDEIVEQGLGSGGGGAQERRLGLEALNRSDVGFAVRRGEGTPRCVS